LRITLASRLFESSVPEKQIRERTGHRSDSLFRYEKPSKDQVQFVSSVLAPPLISASDSLVEKQKNEEVCDNPIFDAISDELLTTLDFPGLSAPSVSNAVSSPSNNVGDYPIFNAVSDELLTMHFRFS
jgi:hypothetical protein